MLFRIVALTSLIAVSGAQAQELWKGAQAGETSAQIKQKFPKLEFVKPVDPKFRTVDSPPVDPARTEWRLADVDFADVDGHATFIFKNDRLTSVALSMDNNATSSVAVDSTFDQLVGLLRKKYGTPVTCSTTSIANYCDWIAAGVLVKASKYRLFDEPGFVNVSYTPKDAGVDRNL